tara:strand:+ start:335 stop:559 length:225 start_codon:yes stop_codon:yes gene_type:complete
MRGAELGAGAVLEPCLRVNASIDGITGICAMDGVWRSIAGLCRAKDHACYLCWLVATEAKTDGLRGELHTPIIG